MPNSTMKHVVWVPFTIDRPTYTPPPEWVRERFALFHDFTLPSLLRQGVPPDEIHVVCGERHRTLTLSLDWHPSVRCVYDDGAAALAELTDSGAAHIAFTRIDSDDLMRLDGFETIRQHSHRLAHPTRVTAHACPQNDLWDRRNGTIATHGNTTRRRLPPFVTRIFPRAICRDFVAWRDTMFQKHGENTVATVRPELIPERLFCVVKHGSNILGMQLGRELEPIKTVGELDALQAAGKIVTHDPMFVAEIMARFGVSSEDAARRPEVEFSHGAFTPTK